jgi:hypothetical protein
VRLPLILLLILLLLLVTGCDEPADTTEPTDSAEPLSETVDTDTEHETPEVGVELLFGPVLDSIELSELLTDTEGRNSLLEGYGKFLDSVKDHPDRIMHEEEPVNYFRYLTTAAGEARHNVLFEIPGEDSRWSYMLISTEEDLAIVVRDEKKRNDYAVGFMNGEFVDQTGHIEVETLVAVTSALEADGYGETLNRVRDELMGRLYVLSCTEDEEFALSWYGKTLNIWDDEKALNPVDERDYVMSEIFVRETASGEVRKSIRLTYDIPEEYLDGLLTEKAIP